MKPLRLEITAFGAFAEKEIIDFTEASGVGVLLIHGPTGSGKTTILDAICFALFGDTSGAEREAKEMRSQVAPADLPTLIHYEFSLGTKRYCVERSPEQERPAKRGGGMTTEAHNATLWDQSEVRKPGEEGKLVASGAAKVKKAIVDLFGFDSEQFRRVVILPQGQFRRLLTAESKEKERILQKLFQTTHYGRLERALAERASKMRRAFENDVVAMETLLGHEEVSSIEELVLCIERAEEAQELAKGELPQSKEKSEKASASLQQAIQNNALLDEEAAAGAALKNLRAKEAELATLRRTLTQAKAALPLVPQAEAAEVRAGEACEATAALARAEGELEECSAELARTALALKKQSARQGERTSLVKDKALLEAMHSHVERLDQGRARLEELEARQERAKAALGVAEESLAKSAEELDAASADMAENEKRAAQGDALQLTLASMHAAFAKRETLDGIRIQEPLDSAALDNATQALAAAEAALAGEESASSELEERWHHGQAGALARALKEDEACPVCGSEEHPKLASAPDFLPSEDDLISAKRSLRESRGRLAEQQERAATCRSRVGREEARRKDLEAELGEAAVREKRAWQNEIDESKRSHQQAQEASKRAPSVSLAAEATKAAAQSAALRLEEAKKSLAEGGLDRATVSGSVEELESKVPPDLRPPGSLSAASATLAAKIDALQVAWEKAQSESALAEQEHAASQAILAGAKTLALRAKENATKASDSFEAACRQAGFLDSESFASAQAGVASIGLWETEIRQQEGERRAAEDRLERAEKAADSLVRAELGELVAAAEAGKAALETAIVKEADARNRYERLRKTQREFEAVKARVATQEGKWRIVASVSELANGKVPPRVSFQRFVLGALLDEVLLAANERLGHMSKRRYTLQRRMGSSHKAKASGLELEVMDAYTGMPRPVATLSGGESFLAALALSLGLADVVQGFSGGIRLDTLFIDEGFGTLDSNALDLAIDTLTELNAEGRLVGIISHVDELKSRIPTRLELIPSEVGSRTRFVGVLNGDEEQGPA